MAGNVVTDLYQWMPGHGENHLEVRQDGLDLTVEVAYDGKENTVETKTLIFKTVSYYSVGAFPGVDAIGYKYNYKFDIGCIIKTESSGLSDEWKKYWGSHSQDRNCNHYVSFWDSENQVIHVVAESVEVV